MIFKQLKTCVTYHDFEATENVCDIPHDFEATENVCDIPHDFEATENVCDIPHDFQATEKVCHVIWFYCENEASNLYWNANDRHRMVPYHQTGKGKLSNIFFFFMEKLIWYGSNCMTILDFFISRWKNWPLSRGYLTVADTLWWSLPLWRGGRF